MEFHIIEGGFVFHKEMLSSEIELKKCLVEFFDFLHKMNKINAYMLELALRTMYLKIAL